MKTRYVFVPFEPKSMTFERDARAIGKLVHYGDVQHFKLRIENGIKPERGERPPLTLKGFDPEEHELCVMGHCAAGCVDLSLDHKGIVALDSTRIVDHLKKCGLPEPKAFGKKTLTVILIACEAGQQGNSGAPKFANLLKNALVGAGYRYVNIVASENLVAVKTGKTIEVGILQGTGQPIAADFVNKRSPLVPLRKPSGAR
jgi:hypothetical protein